MNEQNLIKIFEAVISERIPHKKYKVHLEIVRNKSLRHTIELKWRTIRVRISHLLGNAPDYIYSTLAEILLAKLMHYKINPGDRRVYYDYVESHVVPFLPQKKARSTAHYSAQGRYYDLNTLFDNLNTEYFRGELHKPTLGWSLKKAYTRLGFYDSDRNLLVISRIFDSKKADKTVLDFLMYHEMLHIRFPTERINGRRRIHTAEFKKMEKQFPDFERIQKWIHRKRHYL